MKTVVQSKRLIAINLISVVSQFDYELLLINTNFLFARFVRLITYSLLHTSSVILVFEYIKY